MKMKNILLILSLCLCFLSEAFAERGIVVAVNDFYAKKYFIASLEHLRNHIKCDLPIEIWHSGDELSEEIKQILKEYPNVSFCDIAIELKVDKHLYRGWHIKPWIIWLSRFEEVLLMDADVFFLENPESLFHHPGYIGTGAYFFCDYKILMPTANYPVDKYLDRRKFISSLIPNPSNCVPNDMKEMWSDEIPTLKNPFVADLGESGCIAINKNIHELSLKETIQLNENRQVTYKYVHGDKETFWMGCEIAGLPYHMNDQRAYELISGIFKLHITQFVGNKLFYIQKQPYRLFLSFSRIINNEGCNRLVTAEEITKIKQCLESIQKVKNSALKGNNR